MVTALIIVAVVEFVVLAFACKRLEEVQQEAREAVDERKAMQAHTFKLLANLDRARNEASILRQMAVKWESVEEQSNLIRLARENYTPGGPSMPTIWMREQANLIDRQRSEEELGVFTMGDK